MSSADYFEWMTIMMMIPLGVVACFFLLITTLFVFVDANERSKSRAFAAAIAIAVALKFWPISVFAYIACTVLIDRHRRPAVFTQPQSSDN